MKKYRESTSVVNQPAPPPPMIPSEAARPRGNSARMSDAFTASLALVVVVGIVCLLAELSARVVLLSALIPWGILGMGRLIALFTMLVEEWLCLIGRPRDLNRDGALGFTTVQVQEEDKGPWGS